MTEFGMGGQMGQGGVSWSQFERDARRLRDAIAAGELHQRLETSQYDAEAAAAGNLINETLDVLIGTFTKAVQSVEQMSIGQIPPPSRMGSRATSRTRRMSATALSTSSTAATRRLPG
ncbi:MAG: hypothetical protein QM757_14960 [Paludibaculum sp.]